MRNKQALHRALDKALDEQGDTYWGSTYVERLKPGDVILRYGKQLTVKRVVQTPKGHLIKVFFEDGSDARYGVGSGLNILRTKTQATDSAALGITAILGALLAWYLDSRADQQRNLESGYNLNNYKPRPRSF
jgi:hypothetical protein